MGRASKPEHIGSIIASISINGKRLLSERAQGPCALCGNETLPENGVVIRDESCHVTCKEKVRAGSFHPMFVFQDFLSIVEIMSRERTYFASLKPRLPHYIEASTPESLCRMITYCLDVLSKDSTVQPASKKRMSDLLISIRQTYLPMNHS